MVVKAFDNGPPLVPITVEQYHQMIAAGIILEGAPIELIEGFLVRKDRAARGCSVISVAPSHCWSLRSLASAIEMVTEGRNCHTNQQAPITLSTSEPEPDVSLVKGRSEAFLQRHPGPADLLAVFEVADSSLDFDRTTKLRLYAAANIPFYWIVNLVEEQVEVYELPLAAEGRYEKRKAYRRGQIVPLLLSSGDEFAIKVDEILPPKDLAI